MEELKEDLTRKRIIETATKHFLEYGYKKVTMDEIAEALGMSKKTLYQFFPSKYELFNAIADEKICYINDYINQVIASQEINFIDKVHTIIKCVSHEHHQMRPAALLDIQKSVPEIWKKIMDIQKEHIAIKFTKLIEIGKNQGYIRTDIPSEVITIIYSSAVLTMLNPEVYNNLNLAPSECFRYAVKVIYEGILTPKGLKELNL
ncbi:MAG: hypothetical protein KatS3mg035_1472 [Bacteroidia bacterium]|nr:MAG: hypothetical protein KatS3mg035_1472 [Bacteroidia bacterium]